MKRIPQLILMTCCLVMASCQTNDEVIADPQNEETTFQKESYNGRFGLGLSDTELFEARNQWLAYITVRVLRENPQMKNQLAPMLSPNNTIAVDQLISNEDLGHFNTLFQGVLYQYIAGTREDGEPKTPPGAAVPTCCGSIDGIMAGLIDYWTVDNCVELYFPNGIIGTGTIETSMVSTAHPLIDSETNNGFKRVLSNRPTVDEVTVNELFAGSYPFTMVVARPVFDNDPCTYPQFSGIVFEEFLDGIDN